MLSKDDNRRVSDTINGLKMSLMGMEYLPYSYTPDPEITRALQAMVKNRERRKLERLIERDNKRRSRRRKRKESRKR